MNSRDISQAAKTAFFILGLLIVCLAIYWLVPWVPGGMENRLFVACDAVLLYLAVFIPPLTLPRLSKASTGRIVSLGILYWGIGLYAVYTIVLIALACSQLYMATHLLIILQLIGLFVLMGVMYFSAVSRDHADAVEANEDALMRNVEHIRSMASSAAIGASALDDTFTDAMGKVEQIREELRYLSPVPESRAYTLEDQICGQLTELSGLIQRAGNGGVSPEELSHKADDVLLLIRQRKALMN